MSLLRCCLALACCFWPRAPPGGDAPARWRRAVARAAAGAGDARGGQHLGDCAQPAESNPLLQDPFFRRFFNIPDQPRGEQSAGSGVIVDAVRGLVLTNNHVIKDAQEVVVTLKDRRQLKAQLVGTDPGTISRCCAFRPGG